MTYQTIKSSNVGSGIAVFLVILMMFFTGCASNMASQQKPTDMEKYEAPKVITGISTSEDSEAVTVWITGSRLLTYTSVKQPFPLAVILYFPETVLGDVHPDYPLDNAFVGSIKTSELTAKGRTSRIEISLKKDLSYEVNRDGNGLKISFEKPSQLSSPAAPKKTGEEKPISAGSEGKSLPAATRMKSVSATSLESSVQISIEADGTIKDYKFFTIENPARIVFDLFHLQDPFKGEQPVPVDSKWVKSIRHYGYPDRIRLMIDTQKPNQAFSANPTENGLLIQVRADLAPSTVEVAKQVQPSDFAAGPLSEKSAAEKPAAATQAKPATPAWVNRIDFSSEGGGKSTLIIGTTRAVKYDIKKTTDKQLQLKLFNAKLPDYRKRPLITTRFESAVDRILPFEAPAFKDTALVAIELREAVPYFVEQTDSLLLIHFEASHIPPKPLDEAKLPAWKQVMSQATAEAGTPKKADPDQKPLQAGPLKTYTGEKISLDFYETDIKNVFRILKEVSGINFAVDKDVTGKVTLSLEKPVPWDQVLDLILKMNQLGMIYEGDIIRIATLGTLKSEEENRQTKIAVAAKAMEQEKAIEPLVTEYIPVNYSNAKGEILPHLEQIRTKDRGTLSVDERTNLIIMTDVAEKIQRAKEIVKELDKVTPQVVIEARIVEASTNFSREIGTQWGAGFGVQPTSLLPSQIGSSGTNIDNRVGVGPQRNTGYDALGGTYGFNTALNFPTTSTAASIGFNFVRLAGTPFVLNAKLLAMESQGEGKIISAPKVVTLDNKKATIKQGLRYPYNKLDDSGNTVTVFENIDLVLEVKPHVTPDNRISMTLSIKKSDLGNIINNQQSFTTKEAETELLVNDGDTVVIGGIIKTTNTLGESGVPGLSKIPVLGWLFKSKSNTNNKEELLIFITPRIVQMEQRNAT